MEIGEKLRKLRIGRKLTQEQVAEIVSIKRSNYGAWEEGRGTPSLEQTKILADFYMLTMEDFLPDSVIKLSKPGFIEKYKAAPVNVRKAIDLLLN